jgi:hypothetical protein
MPRCSFALSLLVPALFLATSPALCGQATPQELPAQEWKPCWWPIWHVSCPSKWAPLPKDARTLRISEVRELLGDNYLLVTSVSRIPPLILTDFASSWGQPFAAVDPGQPMNSDAFPGPHRQLVFAAFSRDTAVLVFISGGFVDTLNVAVFTRAFGGGVWHAVLRDLPTQDIAGLRAALKAGGYVNLGQF